MDSEREHWTISYLISQVRNSVVAARIFDSEAIRKSEQIFNLAFIGTRNTYPHPHLTSDRSCGVPSSGHFPPLLSRETAFRVYVRNTQGMGNLLAMIINEGFGNNVRKSWWDGKCHRKGSKRIKRRIFLEEACHDKSDLLDLVGRFLNSRIAVKSKMSEKTMMQN